ncbi:hypothetical protein JIG36_35975 [Actinoplanes sp. LDG1-06]|uniref:Uncharacterized protein n=1 Tax=Paractinoplanes ovalisporus TaxID=2810368 RepID=A0ABS2AMA9_9ACTN|nr:hypothetical protein [Actinoplanes ovalisporus]MBM2620913.1 hypothetical protein [Actinoplanes ovalisporus]
MTTDDPPVVPTAIKWFATFALAGLPALIALASLIHLSRGDSQSLRVLTQHVPVTGLLMSAFYDAIRFGVTAAAIPLVWVAHIMQPDTLKPWINWVYAAASACAAFLAAITTFSWLLTGLVIAVCWSSAFLIWRRSRIPAARHGWHRKLLVALPPAIAAIAVLQVFSLTAPMPLEIVENRQWPAPRVVYVVAVQDINTIVLNFDGSIEIIPNDDVTSRTVCNDEVAYSSMAQNRNLIALLNGAADHDRSELCRDFDHYVPE